MEPSFRELYDTYAAWLWRFVQRQGVPTRDLEDLAQQVWLHVHRSLPDNGPRADDKRVWLASIVRHVVKTHQRTWARRRETPADDEQMVERRDPETAAERRELLAFVLHAIPNDDQHEAIVLHALEGFTIEEVSEITKAPVGTVQWRVKMARKALTAAMKARNENDTEKQRALVLPLGGVDGVLRALREAPPDVSSEQLARQYERITERIASEGGVTDSQPAPASPPHPSPIKPGFSFSTAGVLVISVLSACLGAWIHSLVAPHERSNIPTIRAELPTPDPTVTPDSTVTPDPSATASTPPTSTVPTTSSSSSAPDAQNAEQWLLDRLRHTHGAEALRLADQHAARFPGSAHAAEREEIAIVALVALGQRNAAAARAANLTRWAPRKRPALERVIGVKF